VRYRCIALPHGAAQRHEFIIDLIGGGAAAREDARIIILLIEQAGIIVGHLVIVPRH